MDAVVVFESMWGNTAAIARAIAAGLGGDAVALTTDAATPAVIEASRLVVAGAPVHALNLPTEATRESASAKRQGEHGLAADVTHPPMREWLEGLPRGPRKYAAYETRIRGPLGHGAARAIARHFLDLGYTELEEPRGFTVALTTRSSDPAALLLPGQEEEARRWGAHLRAVLDRVAAAPSAGA
ncbi:hypothetical protein [uncultured Demequina sp.]|uniref:hypothetical protein n=1 Tax=uncultured Demequina sp. TaxID=693499 RepID=UPI0025E8D172|nr:hypothetical protein [uncultured Demequina sp.]